jgi:hypothetical protein
MSNLLIAPSIMPKAQKNGIINIPQLPIPHLFVGNACGKSGADKPYKQMN